MNWLHRCVYVIDRADGGYVQCRGEIGHDGRHWTHPAGRRRIAGNSWVTLAEWKLRQRSSAPMTLIVCESIAAVTTHLREVTDIAPNYGGHVKRPKALCGAEIAWDTRLPVGAARCLACMRAAMERP